MGCGSGGSGVGVMGFGQTHLVQEFDKLNSGIESCYEAKKSVNSKTKVPKFEINNVFKVSYIKGGQHKKSLRFS